VTENKECGRKEDDEIRVEKEGGEQRKVASDKAFAGYIQNKEGSRFRKKDLKGDAIKGNISTDRVHRHRGVSQRFKAFGFRAFKRAASTRGGAKRGNECLGWKE